MGDDSYLVDTVLLKISFSYGQGLSCPNDHIPVEQRANDRLHKAGHIAPSKRKPLLVAKLDFYAAITGDNT